ncbi:MAG TPA: SRPBCC family protein [Polyangia bacterium]
MSTDVRVEVAIARPRAEVAAFMFDPRNDAAWTTGVIEARPRQEGPLRAGARVERVAKFLGRTFAYEYTVTAASGDDFVEMSVNEPFPMHIRYELADAPDGGTVARIHATGEARGFFRVAAPLLNPMVRRSITADLKQLKECVERR